RQVRRSGGARQPRARHLSNGVRSQTRVYRRRRRQSGERVPEAQPVLPSRAAVSRGDRHLHRDSRSRAFEHGHCADQTGPDAVATASLRRGGGRDTRRLRDTREADRSGSELAGGRTKGPGGGIRLTQAAGEGGEVSSGAGRYGGQSRQRRQAELTNGALNPVNWGGRTRTSNLQSYDAHAPSDAP